MADRQGRVGLDDEVSKYLLAFKSPQVISRLDLAAGTYETRPATRPVTIRQLLTHTSGIGYAWSDPGLAMIEKVTGKTSEAELPLFYEPGEKWTYGASTKVLGDVVEKVSGDALDVFMRRRLFLPLRMRDTGWTVLRLLAPGPEVHEGTFVHHRTATRSLTLTTAGMGVFLIRRDPGEDPRRDQG